MICIFNYSIGPYHDARYQALRKYTNDFCFLAISSKSTKYLWNSMENFPFNTEILFEGDVYENIPHREMKKKVNEKLNALEPKVL
jgi:hypothetical protein